MDSDKGKNLYIPSVKLAVIGTNKDVKVLKADVRELKSGQNRIETKLDATVDKVDSHEVRIKKLEHKPA